MVGVWSKCVQYSGERSLNEHLASGVQNLSRFGVHVIEFYMKSGTSGSFLKLEPFKFEQLGRIVKTAN